MNAEAMGTPAQGAVDVDLHAVAEPGPHAFAESGVEPRSSSGSGSNGPVPGQYVQGPVHRMARDQQVEVAE